MRIAFNTIDDFIEEVQDSVDEGATPVVRCLTDVDDANDDGYRVTFLASYVAEDQLICDLELPCGKNLNAQYQMGSEQAEKSRDELRERLYKMGLKLKKGRYEE